MFKIFYLEYQNLEDLHMFQFQFISVVHVDRIMILYQSKDLEKENCLRTLNRHYISTKD